MLSANEGALIEDLRICGISTAFVAVAWGWLAFAQTEEERPPR
jgi:hypothetical protein